MANHTKLTNEKLLIFKQLLEIGLPLRIIALAMNIHLSTAQKHLGKLADKDYEIVRGRSASQLRMFELYSSWIANPDEFKLLAAGTARDLRPILWAELNLDELMSCIMGMLATIQYFCTPTFEKEISVNERKFFYGYFQILVQKPKTSSHEARTILDDIMKDLHNGNVLFPNEEAFKNRFECYQNLILLQVQDWKDKTVPIVSARLRDRAKEIFFNTLTDIEKQSAERFYEMGWVEANSDFFTEISSERERQIRTKGMRRLIFRNRYQSIIPLLKDQEDAIFSGINEVNDLLQQLSLATDRLSEADKVLKQQNGTIAFLKKRATLSKADLELLGENSEVRMFSNGAFAEFLRTSTRDLDLSVRAFGCLNAARINFVWEIVTKKPNDFLKFRNFGKKSLVEIESLMVEKGMGFGMEFLQHEIESLIVLCYGSKENSPYKDY